MIPGRRMAIHRIALPRERLPTTRTSGLQESRTWMRSGGTSLACQGAVTEARQKYTSLPTGTRAEHRPVTVDQRDVDREFTVALDGLLNLPSSGSTSQ